MNPWVGNGEQKVMRILETLLCVFVVLHRGIPEPKTKQINTGIMF